MPTDCNVDRLYEKYLDLEPDSKLEFQYNQEGLDPDPKAGFPEGPWGPYLPFVHHKTGETFHAADSFDSRALGYTFDVLPEVSPPQLREPPFLLIFPQIKVTEMEESRVLFVYARDKSSPFTPPAAMTREGLLEHPGLAGIGSIFFLAIPGGCENCATRPPFEVYVDVTAALRAGSIHPRDAAFDVLVENEDVRARCPDVHSLSPPALSAVRRLILVSCRCRRGASSRSTRHQCLSLT